MNFESAIINFFKSHGFSVEKIDEDESERPDFLVKDNQHAYIVELKTKFESEEKSEERKGMLLSGKIYGETSPIAPTNRLSGIIKKSQKQLKNHLPEDSVFRLAWFLSVGHGAETKMNQFEATLYGSTSIVNFDEGGFR